jgi:hypothetical protein
MSNSNKSSSKAIDTVARVAATVVVQVGVIAVGVAGGIALIGLLKKKD